MSGNSWKSRHGFVTDRRFKFVIRQLENKVNRIIRNEAQMLWRLQNIVNNQKHYLKKRMGKRRQP